MQIHILPFSDNGHTHKASARCKCKPEVDSTQPRCPIYKHTHIGDYENRFTLEVVSSKKDKK